MPSINPQGLGHLDPAISQYLSKYVNDHKNMAKSGDHFVIRNQLQNGPPVYNHTTKKKVYRKNLFTKTFSHMPSTILQSFSLIGPAISESIQHTQTNKLVSVTQRSLRSPWDKLKISLALGSSLKQSPSLKPHHKKKFIEKIFSSEHSRTYT